MEESRRRWLRDEDQPFGHGVSVKGPNSPTLDQVPMLRRRLDRSNDGRFVDSGPRFAELPQGGGEIIKFNPTLVVQLETVQPRLVPKSVRDSLADLSP